MVSKSIERNELEKAEAILLKEINILSQTDEHKLRDLIQLYINDNQVEHALNLTNAFQLLHPRFSTGNNYSEIVHGFLNANNIEKAVEVFIRISNEERKTPAATPLIKYLIENKEYDILNKVLDANINVHGEISTLRKCALALVETNNIDQASKIFAQLRKDFASKDLLFGLNIKNDLKYLSNLLIATAVLSPNDRTYIYENILLAMCQQGCDANEILEKCKAMVNENLEPSASILKMVRDKLAFRGETLPQEWQTRSEKALTEIDRNLETAVNENRLDDAKHILFDALEDSDKTILRQKLRFLLAKLAENGDVDAFDRLREHFDEATRRELRFYKYETRAHMKSKTGKDLIQKWSKCVDQANENTLKIAIQTFPLEFYDLLANEPNLITECK